MKKTILFILTSYCFIVSSAQVVDQPLKKTGIINGANNTANKTTAAPRWYSYFNDIDNIIGAGTLPANLYPIPMWFDSTIREVFSTGMGTIKYSSAALVIDPVRFDGFNDPAFHYGEMYVGASYSYTVDSVRILGVYAQGYKGSATAVDTLIVSVIPTNYYRYAVKTDPNNIWAAAYLPAGKDTLFGSSVQADSINRTARGTGVISWKYPLPVSMRDTSGNVKVVNLAVPSGGLSVPASSRFAVTVTFKSGDT